MRCVRRFNSNFGKAVFPEPVAKLTPTPRLMGLDNRRMSKSYGNTIDLGEEPASVEKKVKGMFTDPNRKKRSDPGDPHVCNVWSFHGMLNAKDRVERIEKDCRTAQIGCVECKTELAGKMLDGLRPLQEKRRELLSHPAKLDAILAAGNERARKVAAETMKEVREAVFKVR